MELLELPSSLQHYIFRFCDADALFAVSHVCREWKAYAQQEALWLHLSRLNARRAACFTYHLRRGETSTAATADNREGDSTWYSSSAAPTGNPASDDPYAFIFGEAFASAVGSTSTRALPSTPASAHLAVSEADVFQGLRLAEERFPVSSSSIPSAEPPGRTSARTWWWPRMVCPIPPPPWEASAGHESAWTSLARAGDGGHGGVREFTMRFLRYLAFSLSTTYPTSVQMRVPRSDGSHSDDDAEESSPHGETRSRGSLRYVCGCYYCRFVRLDDARHPRGCRRSRDGIALISPNGFTLCLAPLQSRVTSRRKARHNEEDAVRRTVWYTSFLRHFAIAGERGWQQGSSSGGSGGQSRQENGSGVARGFYVSGSTSSPARGAWGADGSEGIVYPKELSLAFRVEWLPLTEPGGQSDRTRRQNGIDDENDDDRAGETTIQDAGIDASECIIGFVDRQDLWRYERAAVDVLAGNSNRLDGTDGNGLPSWLCPNRRTGAAREQWLNAQPEPQPRQAPYQYGRGGTYGAHLFETSSSSPWGPTNSVNDDDDVEAEVASWLAATAQDIVARDHTTNASATTVVYPQSSVPSLWSDTHTSTADRRGVERSSFMPSSSSAGQVFVSPYGSSSASRQDALSTQPPNNGGVFVGDTPNGYGFAVRHQAWIHDQHVSTLALNATEVEVDWGTAVGAFGSGAGDLSGNGSEAGVRTTYIVYHFRTDEDCVHLTVNGEDAGTVLVDAFSDGQVWVPAVSVKGSHCAVTILPPEMVLSD